MAELIASGNCVAVGSTEFFDSDLLRLRHRIKNPFATQRRETALSDASARMSAEMTLL